MKNNVIIPQSHQVEIQSEGTLSLVGKADGKAIFMATGIMWHGDEKLEGFVKNSITFNNLDAEGLAIGDAVIFEYPIEGEIRNPRKLLKSVRNRLMKAILDAAEKAAPDWWPEGSSDYSGDELCKLESKWYEEYIAPYAGRQPQ